ncbi:MAG: tetratricopeptide repeat protein [Geobacteraceae bacterium]|nr:tetratricopeptide repeat protein [Geobacteraceae bacterium]
MGNSEHGHAESPEMLSLMGYSLAREAGQFQKGIELCHKAINMSPHNSEHYLHLGRIYLLANKREQAIKAFHLGLKIRKDARILEEIRQLGSRKSPPFSSLPRGHVVNRVTGKILTTLKLR